MNPLGLSGSASAVLSAPDPFSWRGQMGALFREELGGLPHFWRGEQPDPAREETWSPLLEELSARNRGLNGLTLLVLLEAKNQLPTGLGPPPPERTALEKLLPDTIRLHDPGPIGQGGIGTVYAATDQRSGRPVAVKRFHPWLAELSQLFAVQSHTRLRDLSSLPDFPASLCRVGEIVEAGGEACVLLEYFGGMERRDGIDRNFDLFDWCEERKRRRQWFEPQEVRAIAQAVVRGALYLFDHGLYHVDIRKENILVRADGSVALGDYDMLFREEDKDTAFILPAPYSYWAPEQWRLDCLAGESTLIWSIGILIHELAARISAPKYLFCFHDGPGRYPYSYLIAAWRAVMDGMAPALFAQIIPKTFDPSLVDLAAQANAFDPKDRPTLREMLQGLQGSSGEATGS